MRPQSSRVRPTGAGAGHRVRTRAVLYVLFRLELFAFRDVPQLVDQRMPFDQKGFLRRLIAPLDGLSVTTSSDDLSSLFVSLAFGNSFYL
jgi:hypothetical protein